MPEYWKAKFGADKACDERNQADLKALGRRVLVVLAYEAWHRDSLGPASSPLSVKGS